MDQALEDQSLCGRWKAGPEEKADAFRSSFPYGTLGPASNHCAENTHFECISTSMPKQEKSLKPRLSTVDPNNSHNSVFEGIGFTTHPLRGQLLCPVVLHSVVGPPLSVVMMNSASSYLNRCTDRVRRQLCAGFQLRLRWDNRRIHCRAFLQGCRNICQPFI